MDRRKERRKEGRDGRKERRKKERRRKTERTRTVYFNALVGHKMNSVGPCLG